MPGREACPSQYGCAFSCSDQADLLETAFSVLTKTRMRMGRLMAKSTSPLLRDSANGNFSCDGQVIKHTATETMQGEQIKELSNKNDVCANII